MIKKLSIPTRSREQLIEITDQVATVVRESGVKSGIVTLFVPHTTAAITINENADPSVVSDILHALSEIAPRHAPFYRHVEGNSDAHIKASVIGSSAHVLIEGGELLFGTWQGIYFCEFDGPRTRHLYVKIAAD
ncbi:MAG: secondary thiamine-phosphate synthase enzyme YjbQ [Candidatus Zipacnadales bacterium]